MSEIKITVQISSNFTRWPWQVGKFSQVAFGNISWKIMTIVAFFEDKMVKIATVLWCANSERRKSVLHVVKEFCFTHDLEWMFYFDQPRRNALKVNVDWLIGVTLSRYVHYFDNKLKQYFEKCVNAFWSLNKSSADGISDFDGWRNDTLHNVQDDMAVVFRFYKIGK